MATRKATISVDSSLATAYSAASKTQQKQAQLAMRRALQASLVPSPSAKEPRLSKKETVLFLSINRHLTPEQQERYDELRAKREDETLTPAEHAELLQFVAEIETLWIDRLQALLALARLRHISPQRLMQQLGINPRSYEP
jgi:hypothetical protein